MYSNTKLFTTWTTIILLSLCSAYVKGSRNVSDSGYSNDNVYELWFLTSLVCTFGAALPCETHWSYVPLVLSLELFCPKSDCSYDPLILILSLTDPTHHWSCRFEPRGCMAHWSYELLILRPLGPTNSNWCIKFIYQHYTNVWKAIQDLREWFLDSHNSANCWYWIELVISVNH